MRIIRLMAFLSLTACAGTRSRHPETYARCQHDCNERRRLCPEGDQACQKEYPRCMEQCQWVSDFGRGEVNIPISR